MDDYQPLACDLYDHLEIACMHRYQLAIELVDGSHLLGQALTTQTTAKEEFLLIRTSDGSSVCAWTACWRSPHRRQTPALVGCC